MTVAVVVFALVSAAHFLLLRPHHAGSTLMYAGMAALYAALSAWSVWALWEDGSLRDRVTPRGGDITIGAVVSFVLITASWPARTALVGAAGERRDWLEMVYAQAGEPGSSLVQTLLVLVIAACEELTWRGLVLSNLERSLGRRLGWIACAALYAASMLPTLFTLAGTTSGLNPLLLIAALGAGLVWSFGASLFRRLPPLVVSHMVFTYFAATQFRLPGM